MQSCLLVEEFERFNHFLSRNTLTKSDEPIQGQDQDYVKTTIWF